MRKKLMIIELNEFSAELFERAAHELKLPNINKLLQLRKTTTKTDDRIEHRGLDPWVQWVSIHTGVPSSMHKIKHLGDVPSLEFKQIWEALSDKGISSGVWGAMNASRRNSSLCKFFFPDPWTFSESAYPSNLNGLLSLPRYYSKNYLDVSLSKIVTKSASLIKFLLTSRSFFSIAKNVPFIFLSMARNGLKNHVLFSMFDLVSTLIFVHYKRNFKPDCSVIFLNSIAHLQHHHWRVCNGLNNKLKFGLKAIDKVLSILFQAKEPNESIIFLNALTQKNIEHEQPRVLYRQINPEKFLSDIGISYKKVEQLMTSDGHVFFDSSNDCLKAYTVLKNAEFNGKKLFDIELDDSDKCKLFYQVDYWDSITEDMVICINNKNIHFFDHFEAVVARTGAHVPNGDAYASGINMPSEMYNHELFKFVLNFFNVLNGNTEKGQVIEKAQKVISST